MAKPRFLSIRDFHKTQHYHQRNPPWVKLHKTLLGDRDFMQLPITARYLYFGLLILASECDNKVINDPSWIAQRLSISASDIDLTPLYKRGFLLASSSSIRRYHQTESESSEAETEKEESVGASAPLPKVVPIVRSSVFPEGFHFNARAEEMAKGYGLNVHKELAAFRDHHVARGSLFKDWDAAFRTWLRHAVKFAQKVAR